MGKFPQTGFCWKGQSIIVSSFIFLGNVAGWEWNGFLAKRYQGFGVGRMNVGGQG